MPTLLLLAAGSPLAAANWTASDFGNQPVPIGAGPRALGMGGAFSAVADDATAVTWNPAGLTQCERPEMAASVGWYGSDLQSMEGGSSSDQALRLDHASALWPFFAGGCQQVLGVAWQRQYDFRRSLNVHSQEFLPPDPLDPFAISVTTDDDASLTQSGSFATLGLSYAIEITPGLSLGLSVNQWGDTWTRSSHYQRDTTSVSRSAFSAIFTDSTDTTRTHSESRVINGTSLVLGAFWQATPALTVAVVAKPAYRLRLEDEAQVRSVFDDGSGGIFPSASDVSQTTELRHPSSLTLGAAWRQEDLHTLSCDLTVTRWRQYTLEDATVGSHSPVCFFVDPSDFPDLWTLRLGYEYVSIQPRMILVPRIGLLIEDLPAVTRAPSAAQADQVGATRDRWFGATAGLSLCQRQVIWDAAVQVRYGNDVGAGQYAGPDRTVDLTLTTVRLGVTVQF